MRVWQGSYLCIFKKQIYLVGRCHKHLSVGRFDAGIRSKFFLPESKRPLSQLIGQTKQFIQYFFSLERCWHKTNLRIGCIMKLEWEFWNCKIHLVQSKSLMPIPNVFQQSKEYIDIFLEVKFLTTFYNFYGTRMISIEIWINLMYLPSTMPMYTIWKMA